MSEVVRPNRLCIILIFDMLTLVIRQFHRDKELVVAGNLKMKAYLNEDLLGFGIALSNFPYFMFT